MVLRNSFIQTSINYIYRYPKSAILKFKRFGGILNYLRMIREKDRMNMQSKILPPITSYSDGHPIHFLTGKRFLYQTLFCIQSLSKVTKTKFKFILVDDGSFDADLISQINRQLPYAEIITKSEIDKNLQNRLPPDLYPHLHRKRKEYPHIKKLTDVHTLPGTGWRLVFDSDMLFWGEPLTILSWLTHPTRPIYMIDCQDSYGYSHHLLENICNEVVAKRINVGVIGLNSGDIDWKKLDAWVYQLEQKEGPSYSLEQALTAILIGEKPSTILDSDQYVVNPTSSSVTRKPEILHHYVDLSKERYFKKEWKKI
jgi:hypothetical protein